VPVRPWHNAVMYVCACGVHTSPHSVVRKGTRFEPRLTPRFVVFVEESVLFSNHENKLDLGGGGAGGVTPLGVCDVFMLKIKV
jgi:hypothetical protein